MKTKILLIAIVIVLACVLFEQVKGQKKEDLDKLEIAGLSIAIVGIVLVLISSIFE